MKIINHINVQKHSVAFCIAYWRRGI